MKQKSHIRPIVYVMITVFLTIGYAYLTSSLSINGSTLLKKPTWDVHFENIQVKDGSVTGEQVIDEPEIDTNQTTVTFHVNLKLPGDFYEFTVDAVNAGTIDAMVDNYTDLELTEDQQKYLETSITYEDGEEVLAHQQLLAGDTAIYKIRVAYKLDLEADDLPSNPEQLDLEFSVEYIQADDNAIERRAEHTLYNVFKKEAENGTYAVKYTGNHQDSMDTSLSTKEIYHWRSATGSSESRITAKYISNNLNNVIFGGFCWKMYRTTDTGGVRLLYNGDVVDGQCLYTRPDHVTFGNNSEITLTGNYYFGSSFEYNSSTRKYTLSGNMVQMQWSEDNSQYLIGKFTCLSTSSDSSCSTLYYVLEYADNTKGYCLSSSLKAYSNLGTSKFNLNSNSLAYVGYMYGEPYKTSGYYIESSKGFSNSQNVLSSNGLSTNYWYADSYSYDSSTGRYQLVNPYKVSSNSEYSSLVGKYTIFASSDYSNVMRQIVGVSGSTAYYYQFDSGKFESDYYIRIADSITYDSNTGSYNLNNPSTVLKSSWYNNWNSYLGKYTCGDTSDSCSIPRYISEVYTNKYYYIKCNQNILIAKNRNGLQLTNTTTIRIDELLKDYNSTYSDYIYSCGNTSSTCTESNLIRITSIGSSYYKYAKNNYLGSSISWNGTEYTLNNTIPIEDNTNADNINTHHYFCITPGSVSCTTVGYIYSYAYDRYYYLVLENGQTDVSSMVNEMLTGNRYSSNAKKVIEAWYKYSLINYDNYIEDTIFCNNRTVNNYGGWDPNNGDVTTVLSFTRIPSGSYDISCNSINDKFSVSNNNAKLTYKIGLMSLEERRLLFTVLNYEKYFNHFWYITPNGYNSIYAVNVGSSGSDEWMFSDEWTPAPDENNISLKPVISIKPNTIIESGSGSESDPYKLLLN